MHFVAKFSAPRLLVAAAISIAILTFVSPAIAQTKPSDPSVDSGTHSWGSYDGVHDNVSLTSGNLSFCIPLVSLKGPNNHDLNVPLCYNSQFLEAYTVSGNPVAGDTISYFPWVWPSNTGTTPPMGVGWAFSGSPAFYLASGIYSSGSPVWFMPDGAKYSMESNGAGPDIQGADIYSATSGGPLYTKDGTQFIQSTGSNCPPGGCYKETLPDGATFTYNNTSITDSIGRTVTVQTGSSGFSGSPAISSAATMTVTYPDSSGTTRSVTVQMQTMQFSCSSTGNGPVGSQGLYSMPTAVILANGLTYTFQYDNCGMLRKVTYPSGGYTRYDYQAEASTTGNGQGLVMQYFQNQVVAKHVCPSPAISLGATSAASGNNCPVAEETTTYTPTFNDSNPVMGNANTQNIVVDPVGNKIVYQFALPTSTAGHPAVETSRQYYDVSGNLLKTVTTQYADTTAPGSTMPPDNSGPARLPTVQTTTLDNGMVSQIQWSYDLQDPYSNDSVLTEERVYDYGSGAPGPLIKRTDYTWLHRVNPAAYGWPFNPSDPSGQAKHICDRKTSETVYDGNGKLIAQSKYVYDGNNAGGAGLLTSVQKWRSTDNAWLTTSYQYGGQYGNVTQMTDPNGRVTNYDYTDNYADGISRGSNAFLTKTTDPVGHVTQSQYYWGSGLVAATCGENFSGSCETGLGSRADYASYTYDLIGRKTSTTTGDGGQTTNCFSELGGSNCSAEGYPLQVTSTETISSGVTKTSAVILDGEGKTTRGQLLSDSSCPGGTVNVDTTYDLDDRKYTVTNPYCSNNPSAPTSGTTTYAYDGLSRVIQVTHPDNTYSTNTYTGRAVLSADEGNGTRRIQRISQTDALGRLINVCEVTSQTQQGSSNNSPSSCGLDISGSGFLTTYGYDASNSNGPLESLTSVNQGGVNRSFIYDSLGELKSATNPESGTTTYNYDNDGNLTSKTDAKSIVITYSYDNLNRLTGKSYSDGTTPSACFEYDQSASGNGVGRLTTEWTQMGTCSSAPPSSGVLTQRTFAAYDVEGRVTSDEQCSTLGNCSSTSPYNLTYGYDLAGDVTSFNNGLTGNSALSFTGQYNSAGRLAQVNGALSGGNSQMTALFMAAAYTPAGALSSAQIGVDATQSGISFHRDYNSRLLPIDEVDTVGHTPGTATVQLTGAEQFSAYSGGSITISGAEQQSGSTYDSGTFLVTIGTGQPIQLNYGQGSTPASLASTLASLLSNCSAFGVQAASNGATVYLQSCSAGTSNQYSITVTPDGHNSSFSNYSFSLSKSGSTMTPIMNPTTLSYSGVALTFSTTGSGQLQNGLFSILVFPTAGGSPVSVNNISWGSTDTVYTLAASLASSIGSCATSGAVVGAIASGASVYLVSCQAGTSYKLSGGLDYSNGSAGFQINMTNTPASSALPSITFSGTEQGTQNGAFIVFVSPNQNNSPVTVNWNSTSTPNTLAVSLATGLGSCSTNGNGMVGMATGDTVYMGSCQSGTTYTISASIAGCSCTSTSPPNFSVVLTTTPPTGQLPPVPGATYDAGTATLSVNGTQIASTSYSANSTPETVASALASAAANNSLVAIAVNGDSLTLTALGDGTISDDSYQIAVSSSESSVFATPSFAGSPGSGSLTGGTNVPLYNWAISSYAPNGDVLSMTDSVMGTWSYTYDDFNRLVSGTASAGVDNGLSLGWTYDRYANRWAQNATGSGNASAVQPQLSFSSNNHVDGWSYDLAGNLLNDGRNSYAYDAEGRIVTLNGAPTYVYDAEGRRVAKLNSDGVVTTSYLLDLSGNQITELNVSGQWVHSNVFAGGRLLATYEGSAGPSPNTYHFHLTDWLGTNRMQTNALGNQEELCYSYPFGDGLLCTGTDATEHHFTGKERDTESGNDYFFARYYSSAMGRFLSPDWAAKAWPVPYAKLDDPQTLNLYGYLRNNPVGGVDADGHCGGGPNDPPCNQVKVTATPEKQPVTVDTRTQTFTSADGSKKQTVTTTGPSGELHMVVKVNGTPTDGVKVSETNQTTVTTPAGNNTNPAKVENNTVTKNGGKYDDTVGAGYTPQQATAKEAQAAFSLPTSIVNTNTVTLQIPGVGDQSGFTCQATSIRTITNMPDGADYPTGYTLTTTQPVVTNPPPPQ